MTDSLLELSARLHETAGLLRNKEAVPGLLDALKNAKDSKVRRAALTSLAMLPDERSRSVYAQYLHDKDDRMRAAAAELAGNRHARACVSNTAGKAGDAGGRHNFFRRRAQRGWASL